MIEVVPLPVIGSTLACIISVVHGVCALIPPAGLTTDLGLWMT
jgi:hypothetical protein